MQQLDDGDRAEIAADAVVHILGVLLGIVGAGFLLPRIAQATTANAAIALVLYIIGLLAMLGCSATYNLWPPTPRRELLRRFDHAAIFLMIAGTYSPFTLGHIAGSWSIYLAVAVWAIALLGGWLKLAFPRRFERLAIAAYLALGWLGVLAIGPMVRTMPGAVLILIGVGGVLYSLVS